MKFTSERMKGNQNGFKHGLSRHPLYSVWSQMKQRCTNPNRPKYEHYGGRGIRVCERWMYFPNFVEDMGERPEGTTLNRIDNNGDYCKINCEWQSYSQQNRNRRKYKRTNRTALP